MATTPDIATTLEPAFLDDFSERWLGYRADYDLNGVMRQLGLAPQPGSRGERALVRLQRLGARMRRSR